MSTNKTKKVKMATKSCPECDQQVRYYLKFSILLPIASAQFFFKFYFVFISLTIKTEMGLERLPRLHTCKHAKSQSKASAS